MDFYFGLVIIFCWIVFLVYWTINAKRVKPSQEVKKGTWIYKSVFLYLLIAIALAYRLLLMIGCKAKIFVCNNNLYTLPINSLPAIEYLSVFLIVLGLIVAILARKKLADNWSSVVDYKTSHKLITTGFYKYMRHPIYTGFLLMGFGTFLFFNVKNLCMVFAVGIIFLVIRIRKEEELMSKHFPKEYPEYKKKVKAIIPYIF